MGELTDSPDVRPWLVRRRHLMLIAGPVIVIAVALYFYLTGGRIVSTDDAFIQSARTDISSNVSGPIAMVLVKDNQPVKKGEVLFTLDERPFRIAVAEAQAQLAGARLRIEAMKATYQQRLADRHKLDLDARVTLTAADLRHGTSPIASAHPRGDVTLTYWELLRDMLVDSDNTACDYLLAKVGGPAAVEDTLRSLGIADVRIRKTEADLYADALAHRSFARGGDNVGTPDAIAQLLEAVAAQRAAYLDGTTELMLDLSAARTGATRFRAGLPPAVRLAHKTGLSDTFDGVTDATNDAGIFLLPDGRRVVVVALLAESRADAATRDAVLADVARTVYAAYAP